MTTANDDCRVRGPLIKGAIYYTDNREPSLKNIIIIEDVPVDERRVPCISRKNILTRDQAVVVLDRAMLESDVAQTGENTENMRIIDHIAAEYRRTTPAEPVAA